MTPKSIKNFYPIWAALVAALLLAVAPARATETLTFIHTDVAGSPVAATDINGNVVWREGYRPYGERTRNQAAAANNRQFFHGKAFDADTGLSYFGARYYDPLVGRFMGVDAVGFQEDSIHSFNRYAYGNSNPYKFKDSNGRWATYIHQASVNRVLSFLPEGDRAILRVQQATIDSNQENNVQFQHSMRIPGQNIQQAWEAGNNFVRTELQAARDLEKSGNHEQALQRLGNAIHTMQDTTSPTHRGFQQWDNNGSYKSKMDHVRQEMLDPGAGSKLDAATGRAWQLFRSKQPLPQEILTRP